MKARLGELYKTELKTQLKDELQLKNIMQVPRLSKVVINIGAKDAVGNSKIIGVIRGIVQTISGQKPVQAKARKSVAGFKLREGMPIGVKVTLRGEQMYHFLDKLVSLVLPSVRDFQGVSKKFDGCGNYNLGLTDWMVFPEIDYDNIDHSRGMNISIHTTTEFDDHARLLLKKIGMPFKS